MHFLNTSSFFSATPHAAFYSEAAAIELREMAASEVVIYYLNQSINDIINF